MLKLNDIAKTFNPGTVNEKRLPSGETGIMDDHAVSGGSPRRLNGLRKRPPPAPSMPPPKAGKRPASLA